MKITSVTAWMWHQLHIDRLICHPLWWCIRAKIVSLPQTLLRALYVYTTEKDLPIGLLQFLLIRETACLSSCLCVCLLSTYTIGGCMLGTQGSAISLKWYILLLQVRCCDSVSHLQPFHILHFISEKHRHSVALQSTSQHSQSHWLSSSQAASWLNWAAPCWPILLQRKPTTLFFIERGFGFYQLVAVLIKHTSGL